MTNWPDEIIIIDDKHTHNLEKVLRDLTWVNNLDAYLDMYASKEKTRLAPVDLEDAHNAIDRLPSQLKDFLKDKHNCHFLRDRISAIHVLTETDVENAVRKLRSTTVENGDQNISSPDSALNIRKRSALAFIDCDYSDATSEAQAKLKSMFALLSEDDPWKQAVETPQHVGGCLFGSIFHPCLGSPARGLFWSSVAAPAKSRNFDGVLENRSLHGGVASWIVAAAMALTRWAELQQPEVTVEGLIQELISAHFNSTMRDPGHPHRLSDIPEDILFSKDLRTIPGIEDYKALYYIHDQPRHISTGFFVKLMQQAGKEISCELSHATTFLLPISPGMLFFICLVDFLDCMSVSKVVLRMKNLQDTTIGIALEMNLENPERFRNGILTATLGCGRGIEAFQRLLACKPFPIRNPEDLSQTQYWKISKWPPYPLLGGSTPIYQALLRYDASEDSKDTLEIWWHSDVKHK